ncbi:MAG: hypothetical protein CTY15_01345 [Methylocystis sp.]|nr:MAG: hypothetical protein CTY15_01345 [Methylocystis sp.]
MRVVAAILFSAALAALSVSPANARRGARGAPHAALSGEPAAPPGVKARADEKNISTEKGGPWGGFYGGLNSGRAWSDEAR